MCCTFTYELFKEKLLAVKFLALPASAEFESFLEKRKMELVNGSLSATTSSGSLVGQDPEDLQVTD